MHSTQSQRLIESRALTKSHGGHSQNKAKNSVPKTRQSVGRKYSNVRAGHASTSSIPTTAQKEATYQSRKPTKAADKSNNIPRGAPNRSRSPNGVQAASFNSPRNLKTPHAIQIQRVAEDIRKKLASYQQETQSICQEYD